MRKTYDSRFKSRVALEAMRGELTIAEIASKYQIPPNQVQSWKKWLQEGATEIIMNTSERIIKKLKYSFSLINAKKKIDCYRCA